MNERRWLRNIGIAFDQFWNAVTLGDPDETVSSRLGKAAKRGNRFALLACRLLNRLFRSEHCTEAIEQDEGGESA